MRFLFLTLFLVIAFFQVNLKANIDSNNHYEIKWYDDSNGLPQNSVKSIIQDKYGFIWLSTEKGIIRYDGNSFSVFDASNLEGLKSNRFIFFGGDVDQDSITIYNEDEQLIIINNKIPKIVTYSDKYAKFQRQEDFFTLLDQQFYPNVSYFNFLSKFKTDLENNYCLLFKDTLFFYQDKILIEKVSLSENSFKKYFFVKNKVLYSVFKNGDVNIVKDNQNHFFSNIGDISKGKIFWNKLNNIIYLYNNNKIFELDIKDGKLEKKLILNGLNLDIENVNELFYEENSETFFICSSINGLGVVKSKSFNVYKAGDRKNQNIFYGLMEKNDSCLITPEGYVICSDGFKEDASFNFISDNYSILKDKNKNYWIKRYSELRKYTFDSNYENYEIWYLKGHILDIFFIDDNRLLLLESLKGIKNTISYQLYLFDIDNDSKLNLFESFQDRIYTLHPKDKDNLLMHKEDGIYNFKISEKKLDFLYHHTLSSRSIQYEEKKNSYWFNSYMNGTVNFNGDTAVKMPLDRNGYLSSVHCVIRDKNNNNWITTNKGIFVCQQDDVDDYIAGKVDEIYYYYIDKTEGFNTNEFNGGGNNCGILLKNGYIAFPSLKGMVFFNPDNYKFKTPDKDIFIDKVLLNNQTFHFIDTIFIDKNIDKIKIYITTPYYGNRENIHLEYSLEGPVSYLWDNYDFQNGISFTSLPGGEYSIKFRKRKGFSTDYREKEFLIIVKKKYYETLVFKIFLVLLFVSLIYLIIRFRTQYVLLKNKELKSKIEESTKQLKNTIDLLKENQNALIQQLSYMENISNVISHDVKSPIKYIEMILDKIISNFENKEFPVLEGLEAIKSSSRSLHEYIEKILKEGKANFGKANNKDKVNLYKLINEKINIYQGISSIKNVDLVNRTDKSLTVSSNYHLLSIIIQNILDNSIKHTSEGGVSFYTNINNKEEVELIIEDTGTGIDNNLLEYINASAKSDTFTLEKEWQNPGLGMQLIISLSHLLSVGIEIAHNQPKGTKVTLTFS